jgi:hypothetical protein
MKRLILIFVLALTAAGLNAEQTKSSKKSPAATAAAKSPVPAGATKVDDYTYSFTDEKGVKWTYRKTPFGWSKSKRTTAETSSESTKASKPASVDITAVEDGDLVRFERSTPFGVSRWQKNKSELSESEQAAWNYSKEKRSKEKLATQSSK